MKRQLKFVALFAILTLFGYFVWPTPYRYFVLPPTPPNPGNEFDSGTPAHLIRVSRFTGRIWGIRYGSWYSPAERDEIAEKESEEIKKRCKKAIDAGAFADPRNQRIVELRGYSFTCP